MRSRNKYRTQVLEVTDHAGNMRRHLKVWRVSGKGAIPWEVLQELKDECLGEDVTAVELYPPKSQIVDEINMRHLWEVQDMPFNLHRRA